MGSAPQKQCLRLFDDPKRRQEDIDEGRESHGEQRNRGARTHGEDAHEASWDEQPPDRQRQADMEHGPPEITWSEPLEADIEPDRDQRRSHGECDEEEAHVVSTRSRTARLRSTGRCRQPAGWANSTGGRGGVCGWHS
jgi:hypothetical protein